MGDQTESFALWLIPASAEYRFLDRLISDLAHRFDAPQFEPHLTLVSAAISETQAQAALRDMPRLFECELEIAGIDVQDLYTKTLFIRFRASAQLDQARFGLRGAWKPSPNETFEPHLSLLYKKMPLAEKAALARTIKLPFERVRFAGAKLIAHPPRIETSADIVAWRVIGERAL